MKRITWKKHHKWLGIGFAFFMLMFCVSGIILNHRGWFAHMEVNRKWLPSSYKYAKWNGGLLRGTLKGEFGTDSILIYGNSGLWTTQTLPMSLSQLSRNQQFGCDPSEHYQIPQDKQLKCQHAHKQLEVHDFNQGLPSSADFRNIKACVYTPDGELWTAAQFGLYKYARTQKQWISVPLPFAEDDKLSDLTLKQDTLVAVGRSYLYISVAPYHDFRRVEIHAPNDYDEKVSLFRTVWSLHSGELFGLIGKLFMDGVAIILIILCFTGLIFWILPKYIRRAKAKGKEVKRCAVWLKQNLSWHDTLGRYTFGILLFVAVTGWCLRPPVLIALAQMRVPAIPYTVMDDENAWHDRLRMLRYDEACDDWLLSTSEGLFTLSYLDAIPVRVKQAPPVSVMGLNVWDKDIDGCWLMGSFSGMFKWNRTTHTATDYFTGEVTEGVAGPPFGKFAVAGYTRHFSGSPAIVEYYKGTDAIPMPPHLSTLPISLWNLALEVHTGRIYTILGSGTLIYIFFAGIAAVWCLYSGYHIRKPKNNAKKATFNKP